MNDADTEIPDVVLRLAARARSERDDQNDEVTDRFVAVLELAAQSPPSPLRDAVYALAEQVWAEECIDPPATTDVDLPDAPEEK